MTKTALASTITAVTLAAASAAFADPIRIVQNGSGVAGLSAAVRAAETHKMRVGVLTKGELPQATTRWAQGGVAAVFPFVIMILILLIRPTGLFGWKTIERI